MSFNADWLSLPGGCNALSANATLITPLASERLKITENQEYRIIIKFATSRQTQSLQREQFETLVDQIDSFGGIFDPQRLPPDTEPYATVLGLHPRCECDERDGMITETDGSTCPQLTGHNPTSSTDAQERVRPDLDIYTDMLLLIDALERHDPTAFSEGETPTLINFYILLSDV